MANDNFLNDPFGSDMNNIFNNMMGNMNGYNSENRRYLINGQEVWEQYGSRVWLTLEVTADGVMSLNARLLPFKAAKRNSEKVWSTDAVRILKNWGNSPFYGNPTTVKFTAPQKVLVLFNLWRDNKNYLYLSSWIGLHSALKVDQRAQQPYSMILSDYKIGNNAQ